VVRDYHDCNKTGETGWTVLSNNRETSNPTLAQIISGLKTYADKENRRYAYFVDGGITDNPGLGAIYAVMQLSGGPQAYVRNMGIKLPRYVAVISVNASTDPEPAMDRTNKQPSIAETIRSMSNVQIHLYNNATIDLIQNSLTQWAHLVSTPEWPVTPYFAKLGFVDFEQPEQRHFFNAIPTSFSLSEEQVDKLIEAGHELLRNNPDYQRLLADLGGAVVPVKQ